MQDLITRNSDRVYQTQAKYYDKHRRERHFKVGDLVLKRERLSERYWQIRGQGAHQAFEALDLNSEF